MDDKKVAFGFRDVIATNKTCKSMGLIVERTLRKHYGILDELQEYDLMDGTNFIETDEGEEWKLGL